LPKSPDTSHSLLQFLPSSYCSSTNITGLIMLLFSSCFLRPNETHACPICNMEIGRRIMKELESLLQDAKPFGTNPLIQPGGGAPWPEPSQIRAPHPPEPLQLLLLLADDVQTKDFAFFRCASAATQLGRITANTLHRLAVFDGCTILFWPLTSSLLALSSDVQCCGQWLA
jgi:hypothetical protein